MITQLQPCPIRVGAFPGNSAQGATAPSPSPFLTSPGSHVRPNGQEAPWSEMAQAGGEQEQAGLSTTSSPGACSDPRPQIQRPHQKARQCQGSQGTGSYHRHRLPDPSPRLASPTHLQSDHAKASLTPRSPQNKFVVQSGWPIQCQLLCKWGSPSHQPHRSPRGRKPSPNPSQGLPCQKGRWGPWAAWAPACVLEDMPETTSSPQATTRDLALEGAAVYPHGRRLFASEPGCMAHASPHAASGPAGASFVCGACLPVLGLGCMSELAHVQMETLFALGVSLPADLTKAMGAGQLFRPHPAPRSGVFPFPPLPSVNAPGAWEVPQTKLR